MHKIFIDGAAGTTGLRLRERLAQRADIEVLEIAEELRKDINAKAELAAKADITFLCLPDDAAIEAANTYKNTKIIDTSCAHRTEKGWVYGLPELSKNQREAIKNADRVAVPGCHAGGFNALVYPLVKEGIMPCDYPVVCHSVTGYSGGGKKMIAEYEDENKPSEYKSPRQYGLLQKHKHLKEMKAIPSLEYEPIFNPIVDDFYSGMVVTVPLYSRLLNKNMTLQKMWEFYSEYYKGKQFVKVLPCGYDSLISANTKSGEDSIEIIVTGNDERIILASRFDNLGKGASGAAIQCMNIMLGEEEGKGLVL